MDRWTLYSFSRPFYVRAFFCANLNDLFLSSFLYFFIIQFPMAWTTAEKDTINKSLMLMYKVASNRVCRKSMDAEKLARVAMCMDNFIREENHAVHDKLAHYTKVICKARAEIHRLHERLHDSEEALYQAERDNIELLRRLDAVEAQLLSQSESEFESEDILDRTPPVNRILRF